MLRIHGKDPAITTMYKVAGFNPEHADWHFAKYGPQGDIEVEGRVEDCAACHSKVKGNDYIYTGSVAEE